MSKLEQTLTALWRNGRRSVNDLTTGDFAAITAAFAEEHAAQILLSLDADRAAIGEKVGALVADYFSSIPTDVVGSRRARHALGEVFLAAARRLACMHALRWFDDANNAVRSMSSHKWAGG